MYSRTQALSKLVTLVEIGQSCGGKSGQMRTPGSPRTDRSLLARLPLLVSVRVQTFGFDDIVALDQLVKELVCGTERAIRHEERRKVRAVDCGAEQLDVSRVSFSGVASSDCSPRPS